MKLVFSSNLSWSIYNFRLKLLKELQNEGFEIHVVGAFDKYTKKLQEENFVFTKININNNSKNPFEDLKLIFNYYKIYKSIAPDVICHNAIKPNVYGTFAAGMLNIPVINNISGLGTLFIKESFTTKIAKFLYKISQKKATKVFFQNEDDLKLFIENKLIQKEKCKVIPGSGVNTDKFKPFKKNVDKKEFNFLFVGRLINDKGIREYVDAAKRLKNRCQNVKFNILGPIYGSNETAIRKEELISWLSDGYVEYWGETDFVSEEMKKADCIVLPSYREGLSKVLIEASSMAIPIVTSNVPGCKDVVIDGETGYLVEVKNSVDLSNKMEKMLLLSIEERNVMGAKARKRAVEVFDETIIIKHYKDAIYSI